MSSANRRYLKRMNIDSFGGLFQRSVGPFVPGLNVVSGPNEAGKSTCNAFVRGVLFGWEEARGNARNTYKPKTGERAGSLVFVAKQASETGREDTIVSRTRNADGINVEGPADVLSDIDKDTFATMFALTSSELNSLGKTNIMARLLTAGAGTAASPALALQQVNDSISRCFSHGAAQTESIPNLQDSLRENKEQLSAAAAQTEQLKREDREFHELEQRRGNLSAELKSMNEQIELFTSQRNSLAMLDEQRDALREQKIKLEDDRRALGMHERGFDDGFLARYQHIDAIEDRTIRQGIDNLQERATVLEHSVDMATQDYAASKGTYETLLEADDIQAMRARVARQRKIQIVLSIVLPLIMLCGGIGCFVRGREIASLSVTALGALLVAAAVILAGAAVAMLFRPNKTEEAMQQRIRDAQWVVAQDEKRVVACKDAVDEHARACADMLASWGLGAAQGSLGRARSILDEVARARGESGMLDQREQSIDAQQSILESSIRENEDARIACLNLLGEPLDVPFSVIDDRLAALAQKRGDLQITIDSANARYGELTQVLGQARHSRQFDECKLRNQMLQTRLNEAYETYARLLLERHLLEAAIASWEEHSQPRVYQEAGKLFSLMTDGAWVQIRVNDKGRLEAVDANDRTREPHLLSTGTCQQMYLSLRIALLLTAENVGESIPILADDILVNFDADRRLGAARAIARLAQYRQVIMFTCHDEVVRVVQQVENEVNIVEL